jgi:hypothetical protein
VTRKDVEEIKSHFDGVAAGLRTELKQHVEEQVGGFRTEVKQHVEEQVGTLRAEMGELGDGLRAGFRTELQAGMGSLRAEVAEVRRHAGAMADDLRSEIRMVADGVALANERINQVDLRVDGLTGEMRRGFAGVRAEIHRLHETDDELLRRIESQERRGA